MCLLDGRKEGYQEGVDAAAAGLKKKMRGRVNERVCVRVRACVWVRESVRVFERQREIRDFELPVDTNFNATPGNII